MEEYTLTKKDKAELKAAIKEELAKSSFPDKLSLLVAMITAVDLLRGDIDSHMRAVYYKHGLADSASRYMGAGMLSGMNEYCRVTRRAERLCEEFIEPYQNSAMEEGGAAAYDSMRNSAAELVRFMMLYTDRTRTTEGYEELMKFMCAMPSAGRFSEEDIMRHRVR